MFHRKDPCLLVVQLKEREANYRRDLRRQSGPSRLGCRVPRQHGRHPGSDRSARRAGYLMMNMLGLFWEALFCHDHGLLRPELWPYFAPLVENAKALVRSLYGTGRLVR